MLTQDSAMGSMARARERKGKGGRRAAYIVSVAGSKEVEHHLGGRGKVLEALEHFCTGRGGVTTRELGRRILHGRGEEERGIRGESWAGRGKGGERHERMRSVEIQAKMPRWTAACGRRRLIKGATPHLLVLPADFGIGNSCQGVDLPGETLFVSTGVQRLMASKLVSKTTGEW